MLIKQKWIFRADLIANPKVLYLFGDNLQRVGLGGQAKEMRGERNAVGVATKKAPEMQESAFFTDADLDTNCAQIWRDLLPAVLHMRQGGHVILPLDGLGTGLSELPTRAPKTNAYLEQKLAELEKI